MNYESKSVNDIVQMIGKNEVYLPALQRKFVWKHEQIESLFDSIMRGYPIGTFLFWDIKDARNNEYTFYKFLQNYHEKKEFLNEIAPKPELKEEIIGVLDGQQRLSSMYISLQGTYAYKKLYAKWSNDAAFPTRKFYLNLLKVPDNKGAESFAFEFKFLTDGEGKKIDKNHLWFPVGKILIWGEDPELDEYYDNLLEESDLNEEIRGVIKNGRSKIKKRLRMLHQRLVIEKLINYTRIDEQDLDNILDMFVRVNSGGTILSKSDLLFSTIVANWEEARQEIETFLKHINSKGDGFWFDNDFIMRSCLVLSDCPVLFKVKSFKRENIEKIKCQWESIKSAINKTIDLLIEYGFSGEKLPSQMAIIPIAYYFIKGGKDNNKSRIELRRYLINSLLKRIYGGQGDQALSNIRENLRKDKGNEYILGDKKFEFVKLYDVYFSGAKSLKVSEEDIEEILEYKKGSYTFMVLSLLYPNLKFSQVKFHQDHIHPASLFTDAKLRKYCIPEDEWLEWKELKDQLPNLQLLEGKENESKNKTLLKDWINAKDGSGTPNLEDIEKFKSDNYIPKNVSLEFKDFRLFFDERKKILRDKISKVLL